MFGGLLRRWAASRYGKEIDAYVAHLRGLDDEDVAILVAIAAHHRNALKDQGVDLSDMRHIAAEMPMYHYEMAKAANVLTREKRPHDSLGLQVWMHSLRAIADPTLAPAVTDMWRELARGYPHVGAARALVKEEADIDLNIAHATETPGMFASNL